MILHQLPMNVLRLASPTNVCHISTRLYRYFAPFGKHNKKKLGTDLEAIEKIGEGVHSSHGFAILPPGGKSKQRILCCEWRDAEYLRRPGVFPDICETDRVDVEDLSELAKFFHGSESDSDYDYVYDNQNI
jgi:hypothetical protein